MVNARHNIIAFEHVIFKGCSSGFIYNADITKIKNKLPLFETKDPDREVVYYGDEPLTILACTPCTVQWDFCFSPDDVKKCGIGIVTKMNKQTTAQ